MAERDKKRYEKEMESYDAPPRSAKKGKKRAKDPNAPKKPLSGFFWFCGEERKRIKEQNPGFSVGDVAKECGKLWREVNATTKAKFQEMARLDKARYEEVSHTRIAHLQFQSFILKSIRLKYNLLILVFSKAIKTYKIQQGQMARQQAADAEEEEEEEEDDEDEDD